MPKLHFICRVFSQRESGDFPEFSQFSANLFIFNHEILNRKLIFCAVYWENSVFKVRKYRTKELFQLLLRIKENTNSIYKRGLFHTVHFFIPFSTVSIYYCKAGKKSPNRFHIFVRLPHFMPLAYFYTPPPPTPPLKTLENQKFYNISRGYRKRPMA